MHRDATQSLVVHTFAWPVTDPTFANACSVVVDNGTGKAAVGLGWGGQVGGWLVVWWWVGVVCLSKFRCGRSSFMLLC